MDDIDVELRCVAEGARPACLPAASAAQLRKRQLVRAPLRVLKAAGCAFVVNKRMQPCDVARPVFVDVGGAVPAVLEEKEQCALFADVRTWEDVERVAGAPERVGPALAGWLLGYPVAYVLHSGGAHCLSRHALVVVTARAGGRTVLQFSYPQALEARLAPVVDAAMARRTEAWPRALAAALGPLEVTRAVQPAQRVVL